MVRDPCQLQSGQRQTAWLTHALCLAKDTLSPGYAMQDKDSMFQVGITTLKFKAASSIWQQAPFLGSPLVWFTGNSEEQHFRVEGFSFYSEKVSC